MNKIKVLIMGAGGQGGPCASILSRFENIEQIRLVDIDEKTAEKAASHIGSTKITTGKVNATDSEDVARAAQGVDIVVDVVMPWMATYVMRGALKAGANYINTAFDTPFWDELLTGKELTMDQEFKEAGLTALLGCGMAPGFTNVIAKYYGNKLDRVEEIHMRVGKKKLAKEKYEDLITPWNPGWSPKQALLDCSNPTYALEKGEFVLYSPFSGIEECEFPEPVGILPVTHHSHEEIYSMPRTFPDLVECNFKYFIMPPSAMLYALGLTSQEEVEVNGVKVRPLDLVVSRIPNPGNAFFHENAEALAEADKTAFFEMIIEVAGKKDGERVKYKINCPKMNAPGPELLKLYGTASVNVALPLSIGAVQILEKPQPGVIFADQLDPGRFLELMMGTGYPYKWKEELIKI
ncbi:saccharopine dehydrogenase family protein [Sinanaerobacter chloroacetimidivorans]|uniref:Saccharopine dehydrogenase NADP-binding domain-containing protein n=1 Tax=Sinanaerobacter chloroacetimidivorans TaxID=2818044 RepID=A0A8J7W3W6_9FIRM|nr:saccharopine dehydrogenase NADP-binding domain-containing protein [Sinanaerobacter chloroacetimidivorans]MBR0598903.1 saccharopine dehydrogenase NADP-binding domain-containing protein [Sinanaerobacter chloroacetimidivorans]